jgi:hypothetical protein
MASGYYSEYKERKSGRKKSSGAQGTESRGSVDKGSAIHDKPYGWAKPGPLSNNFSRAWKVPVVKTRVVKAGLK